MPSITYTVKENDAVGRRWLETASGHLLEDDLRVSISTGAASRTMDDEAGRAWEDFERIAAKAERDIREQGTGDEGFDAAIEEAVQHVRYGKC
jgi:hypothetical protein